MLAKILKRGGNVLVLDEPTNDLDLNTLRLLEEALAHFKGSVLVVSHDRYFLNRVCTGILAFEDDGSLHFSPGSYDYYLEKKAERDKQANSYSKLTTSKDKPKKVKPTEKPRKLKWSEEETLKTIEADILVAEEDVAAQEAVIAAPNFYAEHPNDYKDFEAKLKDAQANSAKLYTLWEELEAVKAAYAAYMNS
jgi:ATP-binding cassette subfamily F protein uup